jgi:hypothetical protein
MCSKKYESERREMGKDRTKSQVLQAGAAVGMVLKFLGVFSFPQKPQKVTLRRMTPDLGRRLTPGPRPAISARLLRARCSPRSLKCRLFAPRAAIELVCLLQRSFSSPACADAS